MKYFPHKKGKVFFVQLLLHWIALIDPLRHLKNLDLTHLRILGNYSLFDPLSGLV